MYDDREASSSSALSTKKRRSNTALRDNREVRLAATALAAAISSQTLMLTRCRGLVALARPSDKPQIIDICHRLRVGAERARNDLRQLRGALPERLQSHSRVADLERALAAIEAGVREILHKLASWS
jgi:hypothetical protein